MLRESLDIMRRTIGESHSDYLSNLAALGNVLQSEQRYQESEQLLTKAFESQRRVIGDAHPSTAESAFELARTQGLEGKREEAFKNLQFALEHALSAEYRDGLEKDEAFKSLQGSARFDALLAASRQKVAAAKK